MTRKDAKHKSTKAIDVGNIMAELERSEQSPAQRKGTFKIDASFDEALDTVLKAKPQTKKTKAHKK